MYKNDRQDTTVRPARVLVHPLYNVTEEAPHGVRSYDIALLDFGENETSLPSLNNFTRPICAPSNTTSSKKVSYGSCYRIVLDYIIL